MDSLEKFKITKKPVIHLPYFLQNDQFDFSAALPQKPYYTAFVGRLSEEKGVLHLIKAFSKLKEIPLKIVGTGPLHEQLRSIIVKNSLNHIELLGHLVGENLRRVHSRALFTIAPSVSFDNSPLTIYEAFAIGRPVIGARKGGIPELIKDGVTGFLYEPGNEGELREKVTNLFCNPILANRQGKQAREYAIKKFSSDAHFQALDQIYSALLDKNNMKFGENLGSNLRKMIKVS